MKNENLFTCINLIFLLLIASLISLVSCAKDTNLSAGPSNTDEVECKVKGTVVDYNGMPVNDCSIRVRSLGYLVESVNQLGFDTLSVIDTVTDEMGNYYLPNLKSGYYRIEQKVMGQWAHQTIIKYDNSYKETLFVGKDTLRRVGGIMGRVILPFTEDSVQVCVQVFGLERFYNATEKHDFHLRDLPSGKYRLLIYIKYPIPIQIYFPDSIQVRNGITVDIGTLRVPYLSFYNGCGSWQCDSTILRDILDVNGLQQINVQDVAERDLNGRIVNLKIKAAFLRDLTCNIGAISELRILDIRKNLLTELPEEIGYLRYLHTLKLDSNQLVVLPSSIVDLDSLKTVSCKHNKLTLLPNSIYKMHLDTLDVSDNRLFSLPPQIIQLIGLKFINVSWNELCNVDNSIKNWLDKYNPYWLNTQKCYQTD